VITPRILKLYHSLPPSLRSVAATLRGFYLKRVRHGADSQALREETLERDGWSAAQWERWRSERLAYVLHRAATRVPFYRDQWAARRARGDRSSWEVLENWPLLDKDAVRTNPRAFVADDCDVSRMYEEHTSGTTGTPITLWHSRTSVATLHAIADVRTRGWDGIPTTARWARLGAQLITPVERRRPPFWVWNAAMRQLYLSTYHLAPDLIPHYLDALANYRVAYIAGYPSALQAVAHEAVRLGRTDLGMTAIYTNAEPLSPEQRSLISAAFQCPVRETYGMAEAVAGASECSAGRLHQWPEFGHIELRENGEFVCTGLLNADQPLIRYRVGDRGQKTQAGSCPCGRSLPLLGPIDGRTIDVLVTPDGRQTAPGVVAVFSGLPVRHSQIVQEALDLLVVRVAPAPEFAHEHEKVIVTRLQERMGAIRVLIELVEEVPRAANGKLRAVVSRLSPAQRAAALAAAGGAAEGSLN
jgi:phenylacetate-CoA ligase